MIMMVSILSINERKNRSWVVRKKPPKEVKRKDPVSPILINTISKRKRNTKKRNCLHPAPSTCMKKKVSTGRKGKKRKEKTDSLPSRLLFSLMPF
jgi:hypothetical protein